MHPDIYDFQYPWSSEWVELLHYRENLNSWKEDLALAREKYARTKFDGYLDEIRSITHTIQQLENEIRTLKKAIVNDTYDPYEVLGLAATASGKDIYEAYNHQYDHEQDTCMRWYGCFSDAHGEDERIVFSNKLEESTYALRQLVKAYKSLKALKPYTPPAPWYEKLLISKPSL